MRPTKTQLLTVAALAATLAACGSDKKSDNTPPYTDDGKLTLMSRNLYLGADLTAALGATTAQDFIAATTAAWQEVNGNNFNDRADRIADEIVAAAPDLVALQEASLWRTQTPGDAAQAGTVPATTVAYDYLAALLDRLAARGHPYVAAKTVELFDVEAPTIAGNSTTDIRLTDRLVILAVAGLPVSNVRGQAYSDPNLLQISLLGHPTPIKRGWAAVDVTIGGQTVTVVNTHLESYAAPPRVAQANELVSILAPSTGRVVVVGDLNSLPGTEGEAALAGAGFTDVWAAVNAGDPGFTCCFPADLHQAGALDQRIDYVMTRGSLTPAAPTGGAAASIVGKDAADKTTSGLWPSDHAGLVVTLQPGT